MQHLRSDNLFHVGICIHYLGLKESTSLLRSRQSSGAVQQKVETNIVQTKLFPRKCLVAWELSNCYKKASKFCAKHLQINKQAAKKLKAISSKVFQN